MLDNENPAGKLTNNSITIPHDQLLKMINEAVATATSFLNSVSDDEEEQLQGSLDDECVTSEAISEVLAVSVQKRLKFLITNELKKAKDKKYKAVPNNLKDILKKTGIHPELYSALPPHARISEKKFKELEEFLLLALKPLVNVTNDIHVHEGAKEDDTYAEMVTSLIDVTCTLAQRNYKVNIFSLRPKRSLAVQCVN